MKLKSWIESERGRSTALAKAIDVPPSFVSKMVSGDKAVPLERCVAIEVATHGAVTRQDLRPDDWQKIWPELAHSPTNTAPAMTEAGQGV